jgi:hypothetical protein
MAYDHITDHVEQAQGLVLEQYKNKPRLAAWIASYVGEVQALEDAAYDVIIKRLVDVAVGAQLDTIGRIVAQPRSGQTDDVYRIFISARIRINRSKGQARDLVDVLAIIEAAKYTYTDYRIANTQIEFTTPPVNDAVNLLTLLRDAKAAGVGLFLIVPTDTKDFLFDDASAPVNDADHSFGDANAPDGQGLLSAVYR